MATSTDTLIAEREVQTGGTEAPPQAPPPSRQRRARYAWAAVAAVCAAVGITVGIIVAADSSDSSSVGSFPSVAALERQAERAELTESASFPSVGAIERQAQLEGQAKTHGDHTGEPSTDEFVPGSRHMPNR